MSGSFTRETDQLQRSVPAYEHAVKSQTRTNIPMQKSNTLRTTCGMVDISHRIAPLSIA